MPQDWNGILVVTKEELIPVWYSEYTLEKNIQRYKAKTYGIKRVQLGGNGRQMLIAFDSLPANIKQGIGDPRTLDHILEKFYRRDAEAAEFYSTYQFHDGTYLDLEHQERYITKASVLKALISLRAARVEEIKSKGHKPHRLGETIHNDAMTFIPTLKAKHNVEHGLPSNYRRFNQCLNAFEKDGYLSLISAHHKNNNARKVTNDTIELLNSIFATTKHKPTPAEVKSMYDSFLNGLAIVVNNETGEQYQPKDFKALSERTITTYLGQWQNKIGTYATRSGDRQKLMQMFKPYHSLDRPKYAGSIISIDDRQPPFKSTDGKRVWFYNGIDLGSEAFTCWVHGKDKEGIILEFYRQLVRNYAEWGFNLPAEVEAEMSLNSSFKETFLREGAMFQYVRIEANNARGKRIEAYYRPLRYQFEKKHEGWLARPFALSEANQASADKVPALAYSDIIQSCLDDIYKWNNMPHSVHKTKSRWQVFCEMQNPNLKPTNYLGFLRDIGYKTETSCNAGIIKLNNQECLLGENGKISHGDKLIRLMKQAEGKDLDIYWIDDNQGNILKALIYINDQYICEAVSKPTYNRARIEQTDDDSLNRELMSKYVTTIEGFGRKQKSAIEPVTVIELPKEEKITFRMPGMKEQKKLNLNDYAIPEGGSLDEEEEFDKELVPVQRPSLYDRF